MTRATDCTHVVTLPASEVGALSQGCEECLEKEQDVWVHLRMCLTCGHVGCCDSSPFKHATTHFQDTGHPVMRSFEPGESWRWCYVDKRLV